VRNAAGAAWRILALRGELDDWPHALDGFGLAGSEIRFIGASHVNKDRWDQYIADRAHRRGWRQGQQDECWYPVEEPLPVAAQTQLVQASVVLSLESIAWGYILIAIDVNGRREQVVFSDMDDDLVVFARFVQVLASGGEPHAALTDYASSHFVVRNRLEPGVCELRMTLSQNDGQRHSRLNVLVARDKLVEQFCLLARAIADHPNLGHHFLCHCSLPDDNVSGAPG
jgi:hypothetical protein